MRKLNINQAQQLLNGYNYVQYETELVMDIYNVELKTALAELRENRSQLITSGKLVITDTSIGTEQWGRSFMWDLTHERVTVYAEPNTSGKGHMLYIARMSDNNAWVSVAVLNAYYL